MLVKGTAFLARKYFVIQEQGEESWNTFIKDFAKDNPAFSRNILAVTDIDIFDFIKLNDAIIDRFYGGDKKVAFRIGEVSAEWSLREGPYKKMRMATDHRALVEGQTSIFRMYYSEGNAKARLSDDVVDHWCHVPKPYRHVYLEYVPVGYLRRGLELTGCQVLDTQCIKGFSKGDDEVHYRLPVKILAKDR